MKIYLVDYTLPIVSAWQEVFKDCKDVFPVQSDLKEFVNKTKGIDAVATPGNSYGVMTGGFDLAVIHTFGKKLMTVVQDHIKKQYKGCQPVTSVFDIAIPDSKIHLLHCPTMAMPQVISDPNTVYECTKNTLALAKKNKYETIVLPAFGGLTGGVPAEEEAKQMFRAYQEFKGVKVNEEKK